MLPHVLTSACPDSPSDEQARLLADKQADELAAGDHEAWNRYLWVQKHGDCECAYYWGAAGNSPDHRAGECTCDCGDCKEVQKRRRLWAAIEAGIEARRAADAEEEAAKRAHLAWLDSAEHRAEVEAGEARRREVQAAEQERFRAEQERFRAARQRAEQEGPPWNGIRSTGDPVQDVRLLAAAASVTDAKLCSFDPLTRDRTSPYKGEGLPWAGDFGWLFLHKGRLAEMRASGCREHAEDLAEHRRSEPDCPDWAECDAECDIRISLVPIANWKALRDYFTRNEMAAYTLPEWEARWEPAVTPDAAFQQDMASDFWPGVATLWNFAPVPFLRPDGSLVIASGYDRATGMWALPARAAGQGALPQSLAGQLAELALARGGDWLGPIGELAADLAQRFGLAGMDPNSLVRQVKAAHDELRARGYECQPTGGRTGPKRLTEWRLAKIGPSGPSRPSIAP